MKNFIILALLVGLGASAYFTRPNQAEFNQYIVDQSTSEDHNIFSKGWDTARSKSFADSCTFSDRYLWVNVSKDGHTLYTGAFNHWFNDGAIVDEVKKFEAK
jgi:hypothetical protein